MIDASTIAAVVVLTVCGIVFAAASALAEEWQVSALAVCIAIACHAAAIALVVL